MRAVISRLRALIRRAPGMLLSELVEVESIDEDALIDRHVTGN